MGMLVIVMTRSSTHKAIWWWCDYDEENSLCKLSGDGDRDEKNPNILKQFDDDDDYDEENSLCNLPESNPSVSSWDPTRLNYARLHKKCCQHLHIFQNYLFPRNFWSYASVSSLINHLAWSWVRMDSYVSRSMKSLQDKSWQPKAKLLASQCTVQSMLLYI